MEKIQLVYAEVSVTFQMLEDKKVVIISDTGIFMITTLENSVNYSEDFYPVSEEAREAYGIEYKRMG